MVESDLGEMFVEVEGEGGELGFKGNYERVDDSVADLFLPCIMYYRAQSSQASLRRSIIRHTYILLDLSISMNEKDMRPTRYDFSPMRRRGM